MKKATHRKQALMIAIFLLAFTLSLFSFGTTPAAAGVVPNENSDSVNASKKMAIMSACLR